jgi:hypothetical protein
MRLHVTGKNLFVKVANSLKLQYSICYFKFCATWTLTGNVYSMVHFVIAFIERILLFLNNVLVIVLITVLIRYKKDLYAFVVKTEWHVCSEKNNKIILFRDHSDNKN